MLRRRCGVASPVSAQPCVRPARHVRTDLGPVTHLSDRGVVWAEGPALPEFEQRAPEPGWWETLGYDSNPLTVSQPATDTADSDPVLSSELGQWWMDLAREEIRRTVPKVDEYGSTDLADVGWDLARMRGRDPDLPTSVEEATELGIYFYIRGKLSRWTDAIIRGDRPSDDTLFDISVYIRMAQRVRAAGGWPGLTRKD